MHLSLDFFFIIILFCSILLDKVDGIICLWACYNFLIAYLSGHWVILFFYIIIIIIMR